MAIRIQKYIIAVAGAPVSAEGGFDLEAYARGLEPVAPPPSGFEWVTYQGARIFNNGFPVATDGSALYVVN